jgi:hypothetical protein
MLRGAFFKFIFQNFVDFIILQGSLESANNTITQSHLFLAGNLFLSFCKLAYFVAKFIEAAVVILFQEHLTFFNLLFLLI